jgi:peptidoglycan hydrolase-like protein with peptidoglycan-binding domain
MFRLKYAALVGFTLAFALFAALMWVSTEAHAAPAVPPTPSGLPVAIEPLAPYVEQVACDPHVRPGTARLARLLASTYRSYSASSWSSTYACGTDGDRSEHYDGRAIDWMVDVHNARQRAAAQSAIAWLLATDAAGNRAAMARRLGVMYIIWNNRIWGAWNGRWDSYNNCAHLTSRANDNACHRTHVHLSLSWNGAMARTSYWSKRVVSTDWGPCRPRDLNWAYLYQHANYLGCASFPRVRAPEGASAIKRALVTYSGAPVRRGWGGPAVSAVQRALQVPVTGSYASSTVHAVRTFQVQHHLTVTGAMNAGTWRALLAAVR